MIRRTLMLTIAFCVCAGVVPVAAAPVTTGDPVVLVHGWHGAGADDTLASSNLATWGQWLARDGFDVRWASAVAVDPAATMHDSAKALARHVATASASRPGRPVRIVAHSYGGIVARAFLESEQYARLAADGTRVSELIALGAPMAGIDVWLPLLFVLGDPFNEPSVWELMPAAMAAFNASHVRPNGTRYIIVAGDARRQVPLLWLLPPSDGAVTLASAHALAGRAPGLTELRTDNVHSVTSYTRLFGWRSLLDDQRTYGQALTATGAGAARPAADGPRQGPEAAIASPGGFAHTPVRTVVLGPGETRALELGATGALGYLVGSDDSVQLSHVGPGSDTLDTANGPGAVAATQILGRTALMVPGMAGGNTLLAHNAGAAPARVAWLGLVAPRARGVGLATRVVGDRVSVTVTGPAGFEASTVAVHGRDGARPAGLQAPGGDGTTAWTHSRGPGDLLYIQVIGSLDGQPLQVETTLQAPATE